MSSNIYIAKEFQQQLVSHIYRVALSLQHPFKGAQILAIQGHPGSGKSFQVKHVLEKYNVTCINIETSNLSGRYEGDSITELKEKYLELGKSEKLSALILDDFDISISATGKNVERTSNSDLLNLLLMHICDNPSNVDGQQCYPVPIILTGNDFTNLYPPLLRSGRSVIYTWKPDSGTLYKMVQVLFNGFSLTQQDISVLVDRYKGSQISFFQQIISHIIDELALDISEGGFLNSRKDLQSKGISYLQKRCASISANEIYKIANRINNQAEGFIQ